MNICIAEHHFLILQGIKSVLCENINCTITKVVQSSEELNSVSFNREPEILILDIDMLGQEVMNTVERILSKTPKLKILAISDIEDEKRVKDAMQAGASGYISKNQSTDELVKAVKKIDHGNIYLSDETVGMLYNKADELAENRELSEELTEREIEVLILICQELTNREIADKLSISVRTVDAHRSNILQKTGANNTAGLVKYAIKHQIYNL